MRGFCLSLPAIPVAHLNVGAVDDALIAFQAAEAGFAALTYRTELAKTWLERARLSEFRGDIANAMTDVERAYQVVCKLDLPLRMAFCEKYLGWLAALRGAYDRSILLSLQANDRFLRLKRTDALADCDLHVAPRAADPSVARRLWPWALYGTPRRPRCGPSMLW
jgi:hypothetical protein